MRERLKLTPMHEVLLVGILAAAVAVVFSVQHGLDGWGELLRVGWSALVVAGLAGAAQGLVEARRGRHGMLSFTVRFFSLLLVVFLANRVSGQLAAAFWAGAVVVTAYAVAGSVTWVAARGLSREDE